MMIKTLTLAAAGIASLVAVAPADAQTWHRERVVTRTVVVNHRPGDHRFYGQRRFYGRPGYYHRGYGWQHRGYGDHRCFTTWYHGHPVRHCR